MCVREFGKIVRYACYNGWLEKMGERGLRAWGEGEARVEDFWRGERKLFLHRETLTFVLPFSSSFPKHN